MFDPESTGAPTPPPPGRPIHSERRAHERRPGVERRARIAWHEGHGRFRVVSAELVDISEKAARLVFGGSIEPDRRVWLGLASFPWEWVGATARPGDRPDRPGHFLLEFRESCPAGLFDRATVAPEDEEPAWPFGPISDLCWGD